MKLVECIEQNAASVTKRMKDSVEERYVFIAFAILVALFTIIATCLNQLPVKDAILFWGYQVLCLALPGMTLLRILKISFPNILFFTGMGYAVGYALDILTYILSIPFGMVWTQWMCLIPLLHYTLAILSALYWVVNRQKKLPVDNKAPLVDVIFFCMLVGGTFILRFLCFGIPNRLPTCGGEQAYYCDTLYWLGNAISLSRSFPPESMRGVGEIISYHYFSSMQLVCIEKTTGLSLPIVGLAYSYIQSTLITVGGVYCMMAWLLKNKWKIALALLLLTFFTGHEEITGVFFSSHMLSGPFGYEIAMGLCAMGIYLLIQQYENKALKFGDMSVYVLLLTITIGTKAPWGIFLLGFEGIMCLYWLFSHKLRWRCIVYGVSSVAICAIVYMVFMSGGASWIMDPSMKEVKSTITQKETQAIKEESLLADEENKGNLLSWEGMAQFSPLIREWYSSPDYQVTTTWRKAYLSLRMVLLFAFYTMPGAFVLFGFGALHLLTHPKQSNIIQWSCLILVCLGTISTLFLSMSGGSQVYFIEASIMFAIMLGLYKAPNEKPEKLLETTKWIVAIPLIILCVVNAWVYNRPIVLDAVSTITTGKAQLTSRFAYNIESNLITPQEELGYEWIQQNTDSDAILITNSTIYTRGPFKVSVFAARRMYMESNAAPSVSREEADKRYALTEAFMKGEEQAYLELRDFGVDYAIILKRFETGEEYTRHLRCVYENEDIAIYSMNN